MIHVIVVEDNEIINETLTTLLRKSEGITCTGSFYDCESMLKKIEKLEVDIILMDIKLPGKSGIEGVREVKKIRPEITILMLTIYEENDLIFEALCAGASGYLVKKTHPAKIISAIEEAYEGGAPMSSHIARKVTSFFQTNKKLSPDPHMLTDRELEILKELMTGKTYYAIAVECKISADTVRFHIKKIYQKLHVHSQAEAVAEAIRKGII